MTKYKYTKKNCYEVASAIIGGINYSKERGNGSINYVIYLYDYEEKLRAYVHTKGEGLWEFIYKEKGRNVPHTHNWVEITDWFRDMPPYTKKELANMIYEFYEVLQ